MVGDVGKDFVISNPLIFIPHTLRLRRIPTRIPYTEPVKAFEAFNRPAQIEDAPDDVPLNQPLLKARTLLTCPPRIDPGSMLEFWTTARA